MGTQSLLVHRHAAKRLVPEVCVFLLLTAILLGPPFSALQGFPKVRPEQILVLGICYIYFIGLMARRIPTPKFHYVYLWGLLFSVSVMVSMVYGVEFLNQDIIGRDYYEIAKAWLPVLLFVVAYEARLSEESLRRFVIVLALNTAAVCGYALAQHLGLPGLNRLNSYYSVGLHHDIALERMLARSTSTFGNPNILGQFLSCAAICFTLAAVSQLGRRIWSVIIASAAVFGMVLSESRYALIVLAFGLILLMLLMGTSRRRLARTVGFLALFAAIAMIFIGTIRHEPVRAGRFEELRRPLEVHSLRVRMDIMWVDAYGDFKASPIFGHGPAKEIYTGIYTDSEYLDVLKRYGLLGFAAYFSIYLWFLNRLRKGLKAMRLFDASTGASLGSTFLVVRAGFVLVLMAMAMNVGMSTYYNFQFGSFLWLFLGLAVQSAETVTNLALQSRQHRLPAGHSGRPYQPPGELVERNQALWRLRSPKRKQLA